jgi:hypothetical protein
MEVKVLTQKTKPSRNQVSAGFASTFYSVNERLFSVMWDSFHYKSEGSINQGCVYLQIDYILA